MCNAPGLGPKGGPEDALVRLPGIKKHLLEGVLQTGNKKSHSPQVLMWPLYH